MKTSFINFFAIMLLMSISFVVNSYSKDITIQKYEVKIKTSAYSEMCKNRIETELKELDGVIDAYLDLTDQVVTVTYDFKVVKSSKLKEMVENLGYDSNIIDDKISIESDGSKKSS